MPTLLFLDYRSKLDAHKLYYIDYFAPIFIKKNTKEFIDLVFVEN